MKVIVCKCMQTGADIKMKVGDEEE